MKRKSRSSFLVHSLFLSCSCLVLCVFFACSVLFIPCSFLNHSLFFPCSFLVRFLSFLVHSLFLSCLSLFCYLVETASQYVYISIFYNLYIYIYNILLLHCICIYRISKAWWLFQEHQITSSLNSPRQIARTRQAFLEIRFNPQLQPSGTSGICVMSFSLFLSSTPASDRKKLNLNRNCPLFFGGKLFFGNVWNRYASLVGVIHVIPMTHLGEYKQTTTRSLTSPACMESGRHQWISIAARRNPGGNLEH